MSYNAKNYTEQGGDVTHIGGELIFDKGASMGGAGVMANMAALTSSVNSIADLRAEYNNLLTELKDSGLMAGDAFTLTVAAAAGANGDANRLYNAGKVSSVAESNGIITITLSDKVANLKDSDGGPGWGTHKWIGIGVSAGISPITGLKYNGSALTAEDVTEATNCSLGAGYFVRWVAADLVLAGDNSQKSVDSFELSASGYAKTKYKFRIVEPSEG